MLAPATPRTARQSYNTTDAASPDTYVPLPRRLMEDLRGTTAALGVFVLLARLFQITSEAVPLSPGDIHAYDPSMSTGAARRALNRLVDDGYAIIEDSTGPKFRYRPSWGMVAGAPRPWEHDKPSWGRPRHIFAVRLDDRLLDTCIGRLRPHPVHPAVVDRYIATPLLNLRDIGIYALGLAGIRKPGATLTRLGLLDSAGHPLPLPADTTVLAIASQRLAEGLTPAGWRRAGFALPSAPPPPATEQAIFFAPEGMIGGVIGDMIGGVIGGVIGSPEEIDTTASASECAETPVDEPPAGSHGLTDSNGTTTTPLAVPRKGTIGGGGANNSGDSAQTLPPPPPPLSTEQSRLLRAIGVRADVANTFAERPVEQIARVIAQARARQGVRDLAGWVVSALRALPAVEELAPPPPKVTETAILFHPGITGYERMVWLNRFRKADPADRPAVLARFLAEHPLEEPNAPTA